MNFIELKPTDERDMPYKGQGEGFMLTGILSGYLSRMRAASACLFSA